jgi:hypothetical protein
MTGAFINPSIDLHEANKGSLGHLDALMRPVGEGSASTEVAATELHQGQVIQS